MDFFPAAVVQPTVGAIAIGIACAIAVPVTRVSTCRANSDFRRNKFTAEKHPWGLKRKYSQTQNGRLTPNTVYISDNAFGENDLWVPLSGLSGSAKPDGMRWPLNLQRPGVMACRFWQEGPSDPTENNSLGHRLRSPKSRAIQIV